MRKRAGLAAAGQGGGEAPERGKTPSPLTHEDAHLLLAEEA